jgi:chromosome segregation ATPase
VKRYFKIACPGCHEILPIRAEHLGNRVACKKCNHAFIAKPQNVLSSAAAAAYAAAIAAGGPPSDWPLAAAASAPASGVTAAPAPAARPDAEAEALRAQVAKLESELRLARDEALARAAEHAPATEATAQARQRLDQMEEELRQALLAVEAQSAGQGAGAQEAQRAREEAAQLQARVQSLRGEAEETAAKNREELEARRQELADARAETEWLRSLVADLQDNEGRAAEKEIWFREQLAAAEVRAQGFEVVRAERDRLCEEVEQARTAHQELHSDWEKKLQLHGQTAEEQVRAERERVAARLSEADAAFDQMAEKVRHLETERAALQAELEQARGEVAALGAGNADAVEHVERVREEAARHAEQVRTLQQEAERAREEGARHGDLLRGAQGDAEGRKQELAAAQADVENLRDQVVELQGKVLHAAETEGRLRDELAVAVARVQEIEVLRAERDELAVRLRQAPADRAHQADVDGNVMQKALEGVAPKSGWPYFDPVRPEQPPRAADTAAPPSVDVARFEQGIEAMQTEVAREKSTLQNEVARLKKENGLLRDYLQSFGVQMIEM